jgi:hypothetical protein
MPLFCPRSLAPLLACPSCVSSPQSPWPDATCRWPRCMYIISIKTSRTWPAPTPLPPLLCFAAAACLLLLLPLLLLLTLPTTAAFLSHTPPARVPSCHRHSACHFAQTPVPFLRIPVPTRATAARQPQHQTDDAFSRFRFRSLVLRPPASPLSICYPARQLLNSITSSRPIPGLLFLFFSSSFFSI